MRFAALSIVVLSIFTVDAKVDVSPAVADSAARPDDGPSDRVSVEHLDVIAKTTVRFVLFFLVEHKHEQQHTYVTESRGNGETTASTFVSI